jgi:pyruvate formate lyase activating enzyme
MAITTSTAPCAPPPSSAARAKNDAHPDARQGDRGFIHSFQTGSVVDGPGVRFVLWTTGCLMRCLYCHNPDTWHKKHGRPVTVDEIMAEVAKYERFMKIAGGGVTISGGEPLVQAPFVCALLRACKARGIHTTLDTNGYLGDRISDEDLANIDLVLLDLKSFDPETHKRATGIKVDAVLQFARRLSDLGTPAWIRFVLVPGLTDDPDNVDGLAAFVASLSNVEQVEVLPFHQMGRDKWHRIGRPYALADTPTPSPDLVERVTDQFRAYDLPVRHAL